MKKILIEVTIKGDEYDEYSDEILFHDIVDSLDGRFGDDSFALRSHTDVLKALRNTNRYFIDLQNKVALTPHDENTWKLTAKALFDKGGFDENTKEN